MATYYVRHDGTVTYANKALATDPTSASSSLSLASAKLCSFSPGDTVIFSARGGDFSSGFLQVPSSGESGRPITYKGEDGFRCVFTDVSQDYHVNIQGKRYVTIQNMVSNGPVNSGFRVIGNSFGILGKDLVAMRSGNQGFQHEENSGFSPVVEYENITGAYNTDDGMSMHDASRVIIRGGRFFGNDQGINWVSNGKMELYDVSSFGNISYDFWDTQQIPNASVRAVNCYFGGRVEINASFSGGNYMEDVHFERCTFAGVSGAFHPVDLGGASISGGFNANIISCLFEAAPATKYALVFRHMTGTSHVVENCAFVNRVKVGNGLYGGNNLTIRLRNNVFYNCVTGILGSATTSFDSKGLAMYGNTSDFSAVAGWNPTVDISSDPLFTETQIANIRTRGCNWTPLMSSPLIGTASTDTVHMKLGINNVPFNGTIGPIQIAG